MQVPAKHMNIDIQKLRYDSTITHKHLANMHVAKRANTKQTSIMRLGVTIFVVGRCVSLLLLMPCLGNKKGQGGKSLVSQASNAKQTSK